MITGSCVCGAVAFEISAPFESAGWCHCTRCQKRRARRLGLRGAAARRHVRHRARAGVRARVGAAGGLVKAFCTDCGGHLYAAPRRGSSGSRSALGAIDGDPGIRPQYHQFTESAAVWTGSLPEDGLPRYPGRRPAA